eukprot:gnl/Hemi2/10459_TR3616_c0_g1_i1.p1 gnl/Hemi2/10459_TR3616_c0_g1~~gnl/Hemi2/10459_TR3616_c0_g1_i1.p1  ORF type:complete len:488 (-),score=162.26 gnl/Hemi2/10459_TR3616_c0_g1_i1:321-1784(-)
MLRRGCLLGLASLLLWCVLGSASACPPHCWANSCDGSGRCGSCSGAYFGPTCDSPCPVHCWAGSCDRSTGRCGSCSGAWYGDDCDKACPSHCWAGSCIRDTGVCGSCNTGWWGDMCDKPCPVHCWANTCNRQTGACGSCSGPYSGPSCDLPGSCSAPTAANCNFYSSCLQAVQSCPVVQNVMSSKCSEYQGIESQLSPQGKTWSAGVRQCIQQKLSAYVLQAGSQGYTCDGAEAVFFGQHVDCYLHASSVSFCSLPLLDALHIYQHAASIFFSTHIWEATQSAADLKWSCDNRFYGLMLQGWFGASPRAASLAPSAAAAAPPNPTAVLAAINTQLSALAAVQSWEVVGVVSLAGGDASSLSVDVTFRQKAGAPWVANVTDDAAQTIVQKAVQTVAATFSLPPSALFDGSPFSSASAAADSESLADSVLPRQIRLAVLAVLGIAAVALVLVVGLLVFRRPSASTAALRPALSPADVEAVPYVALSASP